MKAIILPGGELRKLGEFARPDSVADFVLDEPVIGHVAWNALKTYLTEALVILDKDGDKVRECFTDNFGYLKVDYFEPKTDCLEDAIFAAREHINGTHFPLKDDEHVFCLDGKTILFPWQIDKIHSLVDFGKYDIAFVVRGECVDDSTRVKLEYRGGSYQIMGSSQSLDDMILTYNMCMKSGFLKKLSEELAGKKDKSLISNIDELSKKYRLFAIDIGPVVYANDPKSTENIFQRMWHNRNATKFILHLADRCSFEMSSIDNVTLSYVYSKFCVQRGESIILPHCACHWSAPCCDYTTVIANEPYTKERAKKLRVTK